MDKPNYLGFAILELSKLLFFETYHDKVQPYSGEKNLHCHYVDNVTKDTPIIKKKNEIIESLRIDEFSDDGNWYMDNIIVTLWGNKNFADCKNIQIWTSDGWQNIKKLVRHKTEKNFSN